MYRHGTKKDGHENVPGARRRYAAALSLGMNMAVGMAVFAGGGYYLDQRRGGGIGWTITGMVLGLCYGIYEVWKTVRDLEDQ